ncbi:hypothetical protein WJX73_003895 [Symbiochloris irregularis]|uniref:Uncharacterized protein n=1 Tax=Symbiochloris irregularis TaxID=706552 RepID=A0AAW1PUQ8_9CHLO
MSDRKSGIRKPAASRKRNPVPDPASPQGSPMQALEAVVGKASYFALDRCKPYEPLLLFSRDAKQLAVCTTGDRTVSGSWLSLYDALSGEEIWKRDLRDWGRPGPGSIVLSTLALAWSADSTHLVGFQVADRPMDHEEDFGIS